MLRRVLLSEMLNQCTRKDGQSATWIQDRHRLLSAWCGQIAHKLGNGEWREELSLMLLILLDRGVRIPSANPLRQL